MLNLEKNFLKKRILIYGLGKSGLSTYSYLKKNNIISLYDDRIITKKNIKDTHRTYKEIIKKEMKIYESLNFINFDFFFKICF